MSVSAVSVSATVETNSNALLDAMEGVLFDCVGRVQTNYRVIDFADQVRELLSRWEALKAAKDVRDRAAWEVAEARRRLEGAAASIVDQATEVAR